MSLDHLKKRRKQMTEKLQQKTESDEKGNSFQDDRFWYPVRDSQGNGYAVIRFLPEPNGEDFPYVYYWHHGFKGPGGWYIENSLTTLKQDDPVTEMNSVLWNAGNDEYKQIARDRKRRLTYVSNILVLQDPKTPENEGKVFLFKYGKKIHDMIKDCLRPEFEDEEPLNPFDFWDGADFKLKIRKVDGQTNYDKSEFEKPSPLFDGDEGKLEEVYGAMHSLQQFVQPDNFKSYDALKQRRDKVIGPNDVYFKLSGETPAVGASQETQEAAATEAQAKETTTRKEAAAATSGAATGAAAASSDDDEGDEMEKFDKAIEDDDDDFPFSDL